MFCKKGFLRKLAKFTGKHLCQSLFLRRRLWHRYFPVNFANLLRTPFFIKHLWGLLLIDDNIWLELYRINVPFSQILDERKIHEYPNLIYFIQLKRKENVVFKRSYGQNLYDENLLIFLACGLSKDYQLLDTGDSQQRINFALHVRLLVKCCCIEVKDNVLKT